MTTTPPSEAPRRRGSRGRFSRRDKITLGLMLGIPAALSILLIWGSALISFGLSFSSWDGVGGLADVEPVGGSNYQQIATIYPPFWPALKNNLIWLAFFLVVATPLGLMFAVLLNKEIRGSRIYQSALFLPFVLSLALTGFIWQLLYSSDQGLINNVFGLEVDWIGDSRINLGSALVAASWRHVGYVMVLYLAGLKAVDPWLIEAAALDGASEFQTFRKVVFPSLWPTNIVVLVITIIESLRAFDLVYVLNQGRNGLELLSVLITQNIIGEATRIGFGSALSVILLVISLIVIIPYLAQVSKKHPTL